MENISVREATIEDLPTLYSFEKGIVEAERPYDSTLKDGEINYYDLRAMIHDPDTKIIVAMKEELIVGSAYASIRNASEYLKHSQYAYLGFMFVPESERGQGINQIIITDLVAWAKSKNIYELRLDVYNQNEAALKAYEKAGFQRHMINMRIGL